ncbi:phosphoglycerate kinase [Candidatus Dojkabacteria bacterium]|uniref:Phosphoglycerate kinase n=1 Tax=Candidatus Dojkabacteria bacterium TaxID=2099670 RepID=A0A3M0Z2D1_9BACT|nr:MAG: phosphoglycerate kinase [Candidatus Dojkabacteria bacterium]
MKFLGEDKIKDCTVLVRTNFDMDLDNGTVVDNTPILAILPTLEFLIKGNNRIVILSSLGDFTGEARDESSLLPVRFEIARQIGKTVKFVSASNPVNSIKYMVPTDVLLIENLFFHNEELPTTSEEQRLSFFKPFLDFCNVYIDESFGVDENLSSVSWLKKKFKNVYYGIQYQKELKVSKSISSYPSPKIAILGGELTSSKLNLMIRNTGKFDKFLLGGFLAKAIIDFIEKGSTFGSFTNEIARVVEKIQNKEIDVLLPIDHICTDTSNNSVEVQTQSCPNEYEPKDIGPNTLILFREVIEMAETILWCGPMGAYKDERFNIGTEAIGEYIALSASRKANKIACGKITLESISKLKIKHKRFTHLSLAEDKFLDLI